MEKRELARVVRKRTRLMANTRPSANPTPNLAVVVQTGTAVPDRIIAIAKAVNDFKNIVYTFLVIPYQNSDFVKHLLLGKHLLTHK